LYKRCIGISHVHMHLYTRPPVLHWENKIFKTPIRRFGPVIKYSGHHGQRSYESYYGVLRDTTTFLVTKFLRNLDLVGGGISLLCHLQYFGARMEQKNVFAVVLYNIPIGSTRDIRSFEDKTIYDRLSATATTTKLLPL